ncbi:ABC transporter permease [Suttonella ornithocola]|uniref:ABC-2 family transporter protein n=1 Tax=Suttonella ornithocola TaxID=279832 RepID=A0A380MSP0_9GAMM|nr:ABC transporter permease [Suttonella ornithocola]SUO95322.1 ABC-2 family transporter protein [Suttonella ornithocola]
MIRALWRIFWRSAFLEGRALLNNTTDRIMLTLLPALAVGFIWYSFSSAQVHALPIGVLDQSHSQLSRQLTRMVDASPNVRIAAQFANQQEAKAALKAVEVFAVLVIPRDFEQHILQMRPSPVVLQVNAQYGTHSGIVQAGVSSAVRTFSGAIEQKVRIKLGLTPVLFPIKPDPKMAFNLATNYQQFLAATIIPALLHILATVVGVSAIGRELRDKTLGHWFRGVCGKEKIGRFWAMLAALNGKLFWQMLAFTFWSLLTLMLIENAEKTTLPSLLITAFNLWMMMLVSLWLGVILTTGLMSMRMGLSNAGIITAPAFAYSGMTYPIVAMPKGAQIVAEMLPLTHYLRLQVAQMETHVPWQSALSTTFGFLIAVSVMAILSILLTLRALNRRHRWGTR